MRDQVLIVMREFLGTYCIVSKDTKDNVLVQITKPDKLFIPIWNELTTEEQFELLHNFIEGDIHSVRLRFKA